MEAQILDVGDREAVSLEERQHLGERGDVGAGKDRALDPRVHAPGARVADEVKQAAAVRPEALLDQLAERGVVARPDVLEHADGDEGVEASSRVAVVVLPKLYAAPHAPAQRRQAREADLLRGQVVRLHLDAVVLRHVERQRTPAAARLEHALARPQPQLAADVIELRALRLLEREARILEVRAGVDEVCVEPARVEIVAEVVVVVDVVARAVLRVAMPARAERVQQVARRARRALRRAEYGFDRLREIALDLELAVGIGLAEAEARIAQQAPERAPSAQVHARDRALLGADLRTVPEDEGDGWTSDGVEQAAQREMGERPRRPRSTRLS